MRASSRASPFSHYNGASLIVLVVILSVLLGVSPGAGSLDADSLDAKGRSIGAMREAQRLDSLRGFRLDQERKRARARLLAAVRLDPAETACLVSMRASRECLFSVPDFNQRAPAFLPLEFSEEISAPSEEFIKGIRNRLVQARAEEAFRDHSENAYRSQAEAEAEAETYAATENRNPSGGNALPDGIDSALVARLYKEEWVSLARAQDRAWFEIYASTDSGLIDSLSPGAVKSGPWAPTRYLARDVPEEWLLHWPALNPMQWSPSLKTAFGYARVKVSRKPPTLKECLPLLIQFASLRINRINRPAPKRESSLQRKAAFQVSARLVPRAKWGHRLREDSLLNLAALRYPMRKMPWLDLPASVQAGIKEPNPFLADYGYWWIDSAGARPVSVEVPGDAVRRESDSLMALSRRILDSKKRDRILTKAEASWRQDLAGKGLSEEKLQAEWIAANLIFRADFRFRN